MNILAVITILLTASLAFGADEKISLRQESSRGISGWTEASHKHSSGQWMNGLLKVKNGEGKMKEFRAQYAFIIGWAVAQDGKAVVIQSQNSHGPYYWQLFEIDSGELLEEFFDVRRQPWPKWVIDFTGTQKQ